MSYKALQDTKTVSAGGGEDEEEDWETDPDFVNTMTEEQQRWGGNRQTCQSCLTMRGSWLNTPCKIIVQHDIVKHRLHICNRDSGVLDMAQLRAEVAAEDGEAARARQQQAGYSYSQGYGGKFGVMADRQDTSALGWDNKQQNEQK